MSKLIPGPEFCLLEMVDEKAEETTASGIIIPQKAKKNGDYRKATVRAVGSATNGWPEEGDTAVIKRHSVGVKLESLDGADLYLVHHKEVHAVERGDG